MLKISRRIFVASLSIFSFFQSTTLLAAPAWEGPYLGAYFGGAFGNNHLSTSVGNVTNTSYFDSTADVQAVNHAGSATNTPSSAIIGIQAGHDWVQDRMVYGVVFDYGSLPLDSSETMHMAYPASTDSYSIHTSMSTNWLFTLRGRLGYQLASRLPTLLYVTGGMAITEVEVKNNFSDNTAYAGSGGGSTSENQIGWAAGVGMELALFRHMSLDLEYLYVQVPSVKNTSTISNTQGGFGIPERSLNSAFSTTGELYANLLKIGLNYRF